MKIGDRFGRLLLLLFFLLLLHLLFLSSRLFSIRFLVCGLLVVSLFVGRFLVFCFFICWLLGFHLQLFFQPSCPLPAVCLPAAFSSAAGGFSAFLAGGSSAIAGSAMTETSEKMIRRATSAVRVVGIRNLKCGGKRAGDSVHVLPILLTHRPLCCARTWIARRLRIIRESMPGS